MANWAIPTLADLKIDVLEQLKLRDVDSYTMAESPTNPPIGAKRWNYGNKTFEAWNGSVWQTMVVSIVGGGTGAQDANGIIASLGLGSMAFQNSNAVSINGGSITSLANLQSAGNIQAVGLYFAGSQGWQITNTAGQLREGTIDNIANIAHINENEAISGTWGFSLKINSWGGLAIQPGQPSAGLNRISFSDATNSTCPAYIQAYEPGTSANNFIIGNNYYGIDGGSSGRRNLTTGGSLIRLGVNQITLAAINAAGAYTTLFISDPNATIIGGTFCTFTAGVLQIAQSNQTAELRMASNGTDVISFYAGANRTGAITHGGATSYYDADSHQWRNGNGSVGYATLGTDGRFAAYALQTNSGWLYGPGGPNDTSIYLGGNSAVTYANVHSWLDETQSVNYMGLDGTRLNVYVPNAYMYGRLYIGGEDGTGMSIWKSGANAVFTCHQGGGTTGSTIWHNAANTEQLMILNGNVLTPFGGLALGNGTPANPIIRFTAGGDSGLYWSGNNSLDIGANINTVNRSVMRTYYGVGGGKVDFLLGDSVMYTIGPWPTHRIGGYFSPATANAFYCGEPSLAWYQLHSMQGYVTTSDIRTKDVHGDIPEDILDLIDSVIPIIASTKESEYDNEHKLIPKEEFLRKFATFSAQDIREKIDGPLGVQTVFGEAKLGVDYGRLTPLLWAAVRRLNARLKALENN